jgi:polyhydroxybutyrate depolymerase
MVIPIDALPVTSAADKPDNTALKLLDEVHHEMDLQSRARRSEGHTARVMDFVYDPLLTDQPRLADLAKRLDASAAKGDYGSILAKQNNINSEVALDQKHLNRKVTVDDVASDVVAVLPMAARAGLVSADEKIEKIFQGGSAVAEHTDLAQGSPNITKPGDYREQMTVNGKQRSYEIHVPPSYKQGTPMPEVLMIHGISQDGDSFAQDTQMNAKADQKGFIAVYPEGNPILRNPTHRAWNVPNWDIVHPARHSDDVQFVSQVIDAVPQELSIDAKRVYVAGFSNGGMLAQEVASQNSDKVAAAALVGTALSGLDLAPKEPVSVIDIHGTADPVVPFQDWDNSLHLVKMEPVSYTGAYWDQADGITKPGEPAVHGNLIERDSVNSRSGVEVKQIGIIGGVHEWPGPNASEPEDKTLVATDEIWDFFSHHRLRPPAPVLDPNDRVVTI